MNTTEAIKKRYEEKWETLYTYDRDTASGNNPYRVCSEKVWLFIEQALDEVRGEDRGKNRKLVESYEEFIKSILHSIGKEVIVLPMMEPEKYILSIKDNIGDFSKTVNLFKKTSKQQ